MRARTAWFFLIGFLVVVVIASCSGSSSDDSPGTGGFGAGTGGSIAAGGNGGSATCTAGKVSCSGVCTDIKTDSNNCNTCGLRCGAGQSCSNGTCVCAAASGTTACGLLCKNLMNDAENCGECGKKCSTGQSCQAGQCQCVTPLVTCNGTCVSTVSDPDNCGMCNTKCAATEVCSEGKCAADCGAGLLKCGRACVESQTDAFNCGMCGRTCGSGQTCTAGECACADPSQKLCGGQCVDVKTNLANCGTCGNVCTGSCVQGVCMTGGGGSGGSGGGGSGGSGGGVTDPNRPPGCPAGPDLISDFEEGQGVLAKQGGRTGYWYTFSDPSPGTLTPPISAGEPVAVEMLPAGEQSECNKYAMHSTATGHPQYVGVGATFIPGPAGTELKQPIDLSAYTGISFKVKSGSGNLPPMMFEVHAKETRPPSEGGTGKNDSIDTYNSRARLLSGVGPTWQTIEVPFRTMGPRYLPGGTSCGGAVLLCESPPLILTNVLGIQFALDAQFKEQGANGAYDIWIDDVKLLKGDEGIGAFTPTGTLPADAAVGSCTKPTGASSKDLIQAYLKWKQTFVTSEGAGGALRVKRPERDNDSVSEGIAYGMLIAANMGDKEVFDGLWAYWKKYPVGGSLMHWRISAGGGVQESGGATDADEDAAFALLVAAKRWGGSYQGDAVKLINDIWSGEVEQGSKVLKPGNAFGGSSLTNPSYFAPAYYRVFKTAASGQDWDGVINSSYEIIGKLAGSNGLVPAWCSGSGCSSPGGGGYPDAAIYQYDSHRTPWRLGLDACWFDEARAKAYVAKTTNFFAGKAATGIGTVSDLYNLDGSVAANNSKTNSMSIIGTAAVGAMVSAASNPGHKSFLDRSYQFILDTTYTIDPTTAPTSPTTAYTYYNATVGLLTAMTMSGNFAKP